MQPELTQYALNYLNIGLVRADTTLKVLEWTPGATRFAAQPIAVGSKLTDVFPALATLSEMLTALLMAASDSFDLHKISHYQTDGSLVYFSLSLLRAFDDQTNQPQILGIVRDMTAEAMLEQGLTQQRDELMSLREKLHVQNSPLLTAATESATLS